VAQENLNSALHSYIVRLFQEAPQVELRGKRENKTNEIKATEIKQKK
jgi:hypothetical protein